MKNLSNFDEFQFLIDSLNLPYEIEWDEPQDNLFLDYFKEHQFQIKIEDLNNNNCWFFKFFRFDEESQEYIEHINIQEKFKKYGESTRILGTVRKSFLDFIERKHPSGIYFMAIDKSKGRKLLYDLFCNQIIIKYPEYFKTKYF